MKKLTKEDEERNKVTPPDDDLISPEGPSKEEEQAEIADLISVEAPAGDVIDEEEPDEKEEKEEKVEEEPEKKVETEDKEEVEEKTEEKKDEEEEEDKEEKDKDPLFDEVQRLSSQLAEDDLSLLGKQDYKPKEDKKDEKEGEEKKDTEPEPKKKDSFDTFVEDIVSAPVAQKVEFVKKDTFGEIFDEKEVAVFNEVINNAVASAVQAARKQAIRDGIETFPKVLDRRFKSLIAANDFWRGNPDIKRMCDKYPDFRKYISRLVRDTEKSNPNYTLYQIFDTTAKEVRRVLGKDRMAKFQEENEEVDSDKDGKKGPAFASKPNRSARGKPEKKAEVPQEEESEAAQIQELIEYSKEG